MIMKTLTALALACSLSGCATVVSQSNYPVYVQSAPEKADFEIKNSRGVTLKSGTTPMLVNLDSGAGYFKRANYTVSFSKPGYQPVIENLSATMDGWYLGNLFIGGVIGFLFVDPATGAMWELPESLTTTLQRDSIEPDSH